MGADLLLYAASIASFLAASLVGDAAAVVLTTTSIRPSSTTAWPTTTTIAASTTLPPDPTNILYIAIPVGILLGVPLLIAGALCCVGMMAAMGKAKHNAQNNRVTPIQDPDYNDITTPVQRVNIPVADDPFTYGYGDAPFQDGQVTELERRPRYAQDWNY